MKPEETVRRMAERAMGRHRLGAHDLAKAVGCGDTTVVGLTLSLWTLWDEIKRRKKK